MNRLNKETAVMRLRDRAKSLVAKTALAATTAMVATSAFAQETLPTDIAGITTWATPKVIAALGIGVFITVCIIALRVNKLPRRA